MESSRYDRKAEKKSDGSTSVSQTLGVPERKFAAGEGEETVAVAEEGEELGEALEVEEEDEEGESRSCCARASSCLMTERVACVTLRAELRGGLEAVNTTAGSR